MFDASGEEACFEDELPENDSPLWLSIILRPDQHSLHLLYHRSGNNSIGKRVEQRYRQKMRLKM